MPVSSSAAFSDVASTRVRFGDALVDAGALGFVGAGLALQRVFFARQPCQRRLGVRSQAPLALDVGAELDQAAVELGHAVLGARLLAFERLARRDQTLQGGGGLGLGLAQGRQVGGRERLARRRLGLLAGALGDHAARPHSWRARPRQARHWRPTQRR